jgi:tripartite ATP-independent transporter DctP family solute receptor
MRTNRISGGIFLLLLLFLISACGDRKVKVIKLAHGHDSKHPVYHTLEFFAKRVAEKSGGTMRVDIYPGQQLGSEREVLELLQIGSLGMTKVSSGAMEGFVPVFKVFGLPYLFRDDEHKFKVVEGEIGWELLREGEAVGVRGLCYYDAGNRSFYTKSRPIHTPADLNGLKIRVMESPTAVNMVKSMGGAPTPISYGELYTALQQGVVDGAENNPPSFYSSRHYEVCKYYTLDEHTFLPDLLLISQVIWDTLDEQQRQWVLEAAGESTGFHQKVWNESVALSMAEVQKAGVEIIKPDKEAFAAKVGPVYELYRQDTKIFGYVQRIQAAGLEPAETLQ